MSQSPVILLEMNRLVAAISKIDGHAFVGPFQTSAAQQNVRQLREKNQVNARTSLLVLALFSCLSARMTLVGTSLEEKYFEIRDNFIRQFEKASVPIDVLDEKDKHALAELDRQLKPIIGPVNFEGFPKEGKINLLTLQKDYGFGQVDGLRFRAKQEELFVTTDNILKKYLAGQRELPKDLAELSKTGEFYVRAITAEAAVTYFAEIPVKSANGKSYVHAFLGLTAQDIGPSSQKISLYSLRTEIEYSQSSRQRQLRSRKFRSVETSGRSLPRRRQTQWRFIDPPA